MMKRVTAAAAGMQCLRLRCLARRKAMLNVPLVCGNPKGRGSLFSALLWLAKKKKGEAREGERGQKEQAERDCIDQQLLHASHQGNTQPVLRAGHID